MAKRMLSLLLAVVMVLGMVPAVTLTASAEEATQTTPTPLWSEDFEDNTAGAAYTFDGLTTPVGHSVVTSKGDTKSDHYYNFDVEAVDGDNCLHITHDDAARAEGGQVCCYGFNTYSGDLGDVSAVVVNFSVKISTEMNTFQVVMRTKTGGCLVALRFGNGTVTYDYGSTKWSNTVEAFPDITKRSASISKNEWHDLQFIGIQRSGEGEKDYWALMENGEILLCYEGDYHFGNNAAVTAGFGKVDFYIMTATSGTVQINNTWLDDLAAYEYIGADSVAFAKSEYTVQPGGAVQTAVVVTPTLTVPAVKPVYTSGNTAVATVDANGRVTAVAAGTTTITATLTNPDGSVKTAETTVKVEGAKILWDSDFDSDPLTAADDNFGYLNNLDTGKWQNDAVRNFNGGYDVKIRAEDSDASDHYLSIKAGTATGATPTNYRYVTSAFADAGAIDVRFNIKLHEADGYRDNLSFRLHPNGATDGALMELYFTKDGYVKATNATLNSSGYAVSAEDAAAGLDVRIVAIQNTGTELDKYSVYINGNLALEGTTYGGPYPDKPFQRISINTSAMGVDTFTSRDTRIDDLVVYEYTPVAATGITLDRESATLQVGKTLQLSATVQPADADVAKITYATDAEGVATVSETGLVTAVAAGTATITVTVTSLDGTTKTDTVTVTVPQADPNLLWSEDFENWDGTLEGLKESFTLTNRTDGKDPHYAFTASEEDGNTSMKIAYDAALNPDNVNDKYGFYLASPVFEEANSAVLNFRVKFGDGKNYLELHALDSNGKSLLRLLFDNGKITYTYDGTWSTEPLQLSLNEWHDLQLVLLQRGSEEQDYWALMENGVILMEIGDGEAFKEDTGISKMYIYVQTATSGTILVQSTWFDDLAVYKYVPVTGVALDKDSYALKFGETAQAVATVTPDVIYPTVKPVYTIDKAAVATVDENGKITAVGGGTATLTATVKNADGTTVTDTATITVEKVETVLWDSDFDSETVTAEGQYFNFTTYPDAKEWRPDPDRFTNGDYDVKIVADADDPTNHYLQIKAGAETTATTQFFRYRTQSFTATEAIEISFRLWLNKDANGRWDSFTIQVHPYDVTDANILAIAFGSDGCVTYPVAGGTAKTAQLKANQWQNVRLVVMQNADDAFDAYKLYVDDVLMGQWIGCQYTSDYKTGNPHAFQLITSTGSNGLYTCVDTRIDDLMVRSYTPVEVEGVTLTKEAVTVGNQPVQLYATVAPANVDAYKITYTSAEPAIATVSQTGLITGVAEGQTTVTVTVTASDGTTFSDTVAVTVDGEDLNLLWSDDFDDSNITAADGQYTNTDKWSVTSNGSYNLRVVQDPDNAENKVLHLTNNAPAATTNAFSYASTAFAGREIVEFSFDAWVGYDSESKNADWFQFSVGAAANQPLVNIVIWSNGTLSYATTSSTVWSDATSATVTYNTWHTFRIVVMQREGTENDMWQLWMDDKLIMQQTSFIPSSLVDNLPCYVRINTSGSSSGNYTVRNTYLDNMQVNVFTPVVATAVAAPETMEAEIGRTSQLTVTTTPADANLYKLSYQSANESIVTVDANGKVTGVTEGSTTITVTLTNFDGTTCTDTVTVTAIPAKALVWEEDFDDKEVGSTGGFTVNNTNPDLGSISVQDATEFGGTDNALVMNRIPGGLFVMNGGFELPAAATKMVLEYKLRNTGGDHQNTVLPTLAGAFSNSKRFLSLFINNSMLYWNNGEAVSVQPLSSQRWYTIKLIIDTEEGKFQLYLDGKFVASVDQLLYGNTGDITHVYFQSSPSDDQDMGDGLWLDDFKVSVYIPIAGLELLDDSITIEGQSSQTIRVNTSPEDATGQIIFTSSDESIATVDGNGVVTGVTPGEVTITAETFEGFKDTMQVIVKEVKPTDVTVDQESLTLPVGAHTYIHAQAYPTHATPNVVTMDSSDESVVTVDEWGEVVCLKAGSAKLILTCGDAKVEVPVTVTAAGIMETIQVSPNGTGTTIAGALAQIAAINATDAKMEGNIIVELADGYYYMSSTIQMNETHGGTNGYSVIWKAAEGATPVIGGAKHIAGSQFADTDKDGIYTVDLGALGIPKVADPDTMSTTRQLFVDNVRATRARSTSGLTNAVYWKNGNTHVGHISADEYLANFARVQDLEFVYKELWSNPRCGVTEIFKNGDGTVSIRMDQPGWKYCSGKGNSAAGGDGPVWIENALELLDEPGEWYLNEETQILYYMPRAWEDMDEVTFTLPLLDSHDPEGGVAGLMYIAGTDYANMIHNVHFEGITFADTTWTRPSTLKGHSETQNNHIRETSDYLPEASITVTRANGICFTDCTFTRLGITAVKMVKGVQNSFFVGNHFYDISGGAINIGDPTTGDENNTNPSDYRMMMKNDDVLNNYIHNIGVDYLSAAAISLGFGPNMDFSYNEIFNMPYSGYHIGYGWTSKFVNNLKNLVVSNNFIHDFMGDGVADGGGVYTLGNSGGNKDNYNQVCFNYVKTVLDDSGPLYMDNGATFYEVHHNVVDLSKVTDWRGNKAISWLQMNSGASNLKAHDNYATVSKYNNYAADSEVEPGHLEVAGQWSDEALAIINGAGLQSAYAEKYKALKHAELIVVNLEDGVDMKTGDTFQIQVSYTDGKDVAISGVDYVKHMESLTPDVLTLTADGKLEAVGKGKGIVRIWVVSNDILDVIDRVVYVDDSISEIYLDGYQGKDALSMSIESTGIAVKVTAVMAGGRILPVDSKYVTATVADESIAKLVDGVLVPVATGSTTIQIQVDVEGLTAEVSYKVNIITAASFEIDFMEEMFASQKTDWNNANDSSVWTQENNSTITTKTATWMTFRGATYENELLTFKLKLDTSTTGGWPCIYIRADVADLGSAGSGASGYVICFGNESKGIELQRWNGKTRTMIIGNLTGFPPLSGITNLPHNVDDGKEHLIQVGALTDGGTTRLVLYVDGVQLFDYLDDSADALVGPGYFGLVGRNETFQFSKASGADINQEAMVGGKLYASFEEALAAAKKDETVQLLTNVDTDGVLVSNGVDLDLNGYTLDADYLVAFAGSQVIDSTGNGVLKCENVRLAADNAQLPVWDDAAGGYRFFTVLDQRKFASQDADKFVFYAKPALGTEANNGLMAKTETNQLSFKIRMRWSDSGNEVEQLFGVKAERVASTYSQSGQVITLTVSGAAPYAGKLLVDVCLESETGVIWTGKALTYKGQ